MKPIYLDYNSTTPVDNRVIESMLPYLKVFFGNPHSEHLYGWKAAKSIEDASKKVANLINAESDEIIFTSGATESNNIAIQGIIRSSKESKNHIITTQIEHKSILTTVNFYKKFGFDVTAINTDSHGNIDINNFKKNLRKNTALVSVMLANNEIGTVQPIAQIGAICRERQIVFHTDAAQAVGKIPIDVTELNVDLLSLSGHKMYGPKGIGALYVSRQCPTKPTPLFLGGSQQNGLRAGTVPPFLCVGLGEASRIAKDEMSQDQAHCEACRKLFWSIISSNLEHLALNGSPTSRLPNVLNVLFRGSDGNNLLASLQGQIAASTGSACNTGSLEPSYVLTAIGRTLEEANSSIRFSFGRFSSLLETETAANLIVEKINHFKRLSITN